MKELWFPYTQESCFDAWKRSHMGCSSLLCGRFADSQESRFQALKRSNLGSAVLQGGRLLIFINSVFMLQIVLICNVSKCYGVYLLIVINGILAAKFRARAVLYFKKIDLLMLRNSVFTVRNVEIWAVLSSNEVAMICIYSGIVF